MTKTKSDRKKARVEEESSENLDVAASPPDPAPTMPDDAEAQKLEDGLSFWVASKTIQFKLDELELFLKKTMLAAGFSVEECSVSIQ